MQTPRLYKHLKNIGTGPIFNLHLTDEETDHQEVRKQPPRRYSLMAIFRSPISTVNNLILQTASLKEKTDPSVFIPPSGQHLHHPEFSKLI